MFALYCLSLWCLRFILTLSSSFDIQILQSAPDVLCLLYLTFKLTLNYLLRLFYTAPKNNSFLPLNAEYGVWFLHFTAHLDLIVTEDLNYQVSLWVTLSPVKISHLSHVLKNWEWGVLLWTCSISSSDTILIYDAMLPSTAIFDALEIMIESESAIKWTNWDRRKI